VSHLATFEDPALVVQVEMHGGVCQGVADATGLEVRLARSPRAEQVDHRARRERRRRAESETADRPDVLLELRCRGALDRPMAAVVDPWGELVDDEAAIRHQEQLHGQGADEVHRHGQPLPELGGTRGDLGRDCSGRHGFGEDARVVQVAGQRERGGDAVEAACHDDRDLVLERHLGLGQERLPRRPAETFERTREGPRAVQPDLAPAVVPAGRGLYPHRQPERGRGSLEVVTGPDLAPRGDGRAQFLGEAALGDPILRDEQRPAAGSDRDDLVDGVDHGDRHVLQLVGHDVAERRESKRGADVVVPSHDLAVGDGGRRALGIRIQDGDPVAHRPTGLGEHPAELPASEDADRRGRGDRLQAHGPSVDCGPCDRSSAGASSTSTSANSTT
jgi:hypothetical protein